MTFDGLFAGAVCSGIIWLVILIISIIHVFKRTDIELSNKLLWLIIILLFPFLGLFIYILANLKIARSLLVIGLIGALLSAGLTIYFVYSKPHRDVSKEQGVQLSAQNLYDAFKTNETEANAKYLDKAIELTGEVAAVSKNQDGKTVVDFKTSDPLVVINCTFKTDPGTLQPGQTITFKGICTGYIPDANVVINEGVLVK